MMAGFLGKMFRLSNPPVLTCGDDGFSIAVGVSSFFFFFFFGMACTERYCNAIRTSNDILPNTSKHDFAVYVTCRR
jgi:hypothetical protein